MIYKGAGETFGMDCGIKHKGASRIITMVMILAPRRILKNSPTDEPSDRWFWATVLLPGSETEIVSAFQVRFPSFPTLPAGRYDVHRFIADPPRQYTETNAQVYNRRQSDDWDDDIYEVLAPPPIVTATSTFAETGATYF